MYDFAAPWIAKATSYYGGRARRKRSFRTRATWRPGELKFIDTDIASTDTDTTIVFNNLGLVPQGLDRCDRIGNKIAWNYVFIRLRIKPRATSPGISLFRFIIFRWDDDTAPAAGDILKTNDPLSPLALNKRKFRILIDRLWTMGVATAAPVIRAVKLYKKLNFMGHFDGAANTTGQTGRLFALRVADNATGPSFQMFCRVRFKDP